MRDKDQGYASSIPSASLDGCCRSGRGSVCCLLFWFSSSRGLFLPFLPIFLVALLIFFFSLRQLACVLLCVNNVVHSDLTCGERCEQTLNTAIDRIVPVLAGVVAAIHMICQELSRRWTCCCLDIFLAVGTDDADENDLRL